MSESWKVRNRRWHANAGMFLAITLGLIALSCPFIAHKSDGRIGEALKAIHYGKFLPDAYRWIWIDLQGLGLGFLVISGWMMHRKAVKRVTNVAGDDPRAAGSSVTFIPLGSTAICDAMMQLFRKAGIRCHACAPDAFAKLNLTQERRIVFTGGGEVSPESVRTVAETIGKLGKTVLKRLEYSIDPSIDPASTEALRAALDKAGARAFIELPPPQPGEKAVEIFTPNPATA